MTMERDASQKVLFLKNVLKNSNINKMRFFWNESLHCFENPRGPAPLFGVPTVSSVPSPASTEQP